MELEQRSPDGGLEVYRDADGYRTLAAGRAFAAGEVVSPFGPRAVHDRPTYLTIQTGPGRHIELAPDHLQYCNHSCDPNAFFDTARGELVALRAIGPGEAVTFFYPSTEWEMDRPFACHCGTAACLGTIAGAAQLGRKQLAGYRLAEHITAALGAPASAT